MHTTDNKILFVKVKAGNGIFCPEEKKQANGLMVYVTPILFSHSVSLSKYHFC